MEEFESELLLVRLFPQHHGEDFCLELIRWIEHASAWLCHVVTHTNQQQPAFALALKLLELKNEMSFSKFSFL